MPSKQLQEFLDNQQVKYVTITHSPAYTAQEIAASAHISGKKLAKTVIVKVDGKFAMAVVPASDQVDTEQLKNGIGAKELEIADEEEFKDQFPDCEPGAMPPFGNLYDMEVYVSESLAGDQQIAFSCGSHSEIMLFDYVDLQRLVQPRILEFAEAT